MMKLVFIFIIFQFGRPTTATPNGPKTLSFQQWKKMLRTEAPKRLCQDNSFLIACYPDKKNKCQQIAKNNIDKCIAKISHLKPQQKIKLRPDGYQLGRQVGECYYRLIVSKLNLHGLRKKGADCEL